MEYSEIKKLIPFYIAGTLESDEKNLVENALRNSVELKKEFEFWVRAKEVVAQHAPRLTEHHLTPEQIVMAAQEHPAKELEKHSNIEKHLQECEMCRHEVDIIKSTYPLEKVEGISVPSEEKISKWFERNIQIGYLGSFKFADVFAAAAVVLIIVTVFFTSINKQGVPLIPQEHYADLIIPFSQVTRGNALDEIPKLTLDSQITRINITVYFLHSEIDSVRYAVSISLPSGADTMISNVLLPLRFDNMLDTIRFEVARELFKKIPCNYSLVLTEILPLSKSYLTPESYVYNFKVQ